MNKSDDSPLIRWARDLDAFGRKLQSHSKALLAAEENPFSQREQLERVAKTLTECGVQAFQPPADVKDDIDTACIEATAEFWQHFSASATDHGWELHGSTDRRLVARAFFVELKGDVVNVDGLPGRHSPHTPTLIQALKPQIDVLPIGQKQLQEFVDLLSEAYDNLGGQGDVSIESVFRQAVIVSQSPAFWAIVDPSKFQPLPRPAFRYRLSLALEQGIKPRDGREMRLSPTVNRKDVWEVFSSAEGHVVQVGRIGFYKR